MNWGERRREVQYALKPEPGWRTTKKLHGTYAGRYRIQLANILRSHARNILKYNWLWWIYYYYYFRNSIVVHTETHAERLWFGIPGAEETRCREAAYSDERTSKMDDKLPGKERKFTAWNVFCEIPFSISFFWVIWEERRRVPSTRTLNISRSRVRGELLSKVLNDWAKESHTPLCSNWTMCHGPAVIPAFKQQRLDHVLQKPQTMK